MPDDLLLTASIHVHNTPPEYLAGVLACLRKSEVKIIILLDTYGDKLLPLLEDIDPRIMYLRLPEKGFGTIHNVAINSLTDYIHGYHIIVKPGIIWSGDIVEILVGYLESNPDVGMVVPKTSYTSCEPEPTYSMLPTPIDLIADTILPRTIREKRRRHLTLAGHNPEQPLNAPALHGSFMLFRTRAVLEAGGFDEHFPTYPDTVDLTRRIHEKWKTMYFPGVTIVDFKKEPPTDDTEAQRLRLSSIIRYFNKWGWIIDPKRRLFNHRVRGSITLSSK